MLNPLLARESGKRFLRKRSDHVETKRMKPMKGDGVENLPVSYIRLPTPALVDSSGEFPSVTSAGCRVLYIGSVRVTLVTNETQTDRDYKVVAGCQIQLLL